MNMLHFLKYLGIYLLFKIVLDGFFLYVCPEDPFYNIVCSALFFSLIIVTMSAYFMKEKHKLYLWLIVFIYIFIFCEVIIFIGRTK